MLVDEYQDTNHAQYRLLQLIAGEHRNLAVVGDDAQSVYSFRGADIRNILDFQDDFPDAHVIKLEQNYRSTQTILDASNAVIAHNRGADAQDAVDRPGRGRPGRSSASSTTSTPRRATCSARSSGCATRASRWPRSPCLYRTNAQSRVLQDALVRADVPFQIIGGTKFYERAEVKDALSYLTLLANPADAISFTRVANSPKRGIGQTSLSRVLAHAETMGITTWDAALDPAGVPGLGTAAIRSFERFMATMEGLRERVADNVPMGDLLEAVLHETGYLDALAGRAHDRGPGPDREPRAARRGRARVRRHARRRAGPPRRLPAGDRAALRHRHARRRRRHGHAHDPAQRQGPGVPHHLHDRDGGGRLPALALARRGRRSRRSGGSATSA